MPIVIYARVSSDKQREEGTIASQDGSIDRVCTEPRISSPDGMGLRRRRL